MNSSRARIVPKKSLGQHFLKDPNIIRAIVESCQLSLEDTVLEIGPGQGALTQTIAPRVKHLILVEKDLRLIADLQKRYLDLNVTILHEDFLNLDWNKLPGDLKIIGNLPYNISTPIIESVIGHRHQCRSFHFMVQREYAQRLIGHLGTKDYSSLTCFVNYYSRIWKIMTIAPGAFIPPPKIHSWFMEMQFKNLSELLVNDESRMFSLIRTAFQQRRKMISNSFHEIPEDIREDLILKAGLETRWRAENVSLEQYIKITNLWLDLRPNGK